MILTTGELLTLGSMLVTMGSVGGGLALGQRLILQEVRRINGSLSKHLEGHPLPVEIVQKDTLNTMKRDAEIEHKRLSDEIADLRRDRRSD